MSPQLKSIPLLRLAARLSLLTAVGLLSLGTAAAQTIISVNFQGGDPVGFTTGDTTGAVSAANWNNVASSPTGVRYASFTGSIALNTSSGAASGITLTTWAVGNDGLEGPDSDDSTAQKKLFGGGLNNHFGAASFTITGLDAFSSYDILVYYTAYAFGSTRNGAFTATGSPDTYYAAGISTFETAFTQSNSTVSGTYAQGNYVKFSGLTAATEKITYGNENDRVFMAGFQVVGIPVPEPGAPVLGSLYFGAFAIVRRRRCV